MTDFRSIHEAALEGELEDEPVNVTPGFQSRPRQSAAEQIRHMQEAARARAHVSATLAGRYVAVGLLLIFLGCWIGPGWFRAVEWTLGVLLTARGLWCWEMTAISRREGNLDPAEFLSPSDR